MTMPSMPTRIAKLPRDHRGFPVPWFVQWFNKGKATSYGHGEPDFRVADQRKLYHAINHGSCWVCGEPVGTFKAFVIGPMCAVNRVISEPPCHRDCALFSVRACPFLTRPRMRRNEKDLPENRIEAGGHPIRRNPGVACVWITKTFQLFNAHMGHEGVLFKLGDPVDVLWFCEGRSATRAEVLASIESGYPLLLDAAEHEAGAVADLAKARAQAMTLLPAA